MKRIHVVGLCLMAVFAFSVMAASSASAAPGLLLARVAGGGSIAGVTFLSSATLALLTHSGRETHCKGATTHGKFLSSTLGDILVRFSGCSIANPLGGRLSCNTAGAGAEEVHLPLEGTSFHLGLAHLTNTVGKIPAVVILLDKDVNMDCGGGIAEILVLGSVIGALRLDLTTNHGPIPLNMPLSTALLRFEQTANGLQHLRLFLFEDKLNTYDLHNLTTILGTPEPLSLEAAVAADLLDSFTLPNGNIVPIELFENS